MPGGAIGPSYASQPRERSLFEHLHCEWLYGRSAAEQRPLSGNSHCRRCYCCYCASAPLAATRCLPLPCRHSQHMVQSPRPIARASNTVLCCWASAGRLHPRHPCCPAVPPSTRQNNEVRDHSACLSPVLLVQEYLRVQYCGTLLYCCVEVLYASVSMASSRQRGRCSRGMPATLRAHALRRQLPLQRSLHAPLLGLALRALHVSLSSACLPLSSPVPAHTAGASWLSWRSPPCWPARAAPRPSPSPMCRPSCNSCRRSSSRSPS